MEEGLFKFIEENADLLRFNKRIYMLSNAINLDTARNIFLCSLISSDSLICIDDCKKSLEMLNFIKQNIDLITNDSKIKTDVLKFVKDGIKTVKGDLKRFN